MFEWADFLGLAERLAEAGGDEAAHRTAISRAYYAAYHAAAIYVRAEGILPDAHTHRRVWAALAADAVAERAEVGRRGDLLRQARAAADYRARFPGDVREQARVAIVHARAVIEALRRLG